MRKRDIGQIAATIGRSSTVLTPAEDRAWVDAFNHAIEQSKSARQADIYAAKVVCQQFPRLKKFAKFAP